MRVPELFTEGKGKSRSCRGRCNNAEVREFSMGMRRKKAPVGDSGPVSSSGWLACVAKLSWHDGYGLGMGH